MGKGSSGEGHCHSAELPICHSFALGSLLSAATHEEYEPWIEAVELGSSSFLLLSASATKRVGVEEVLGTRTAKEEGKGMDGHGGCA